MGKDNIVEKILLDAKLRANSFVKEQEGKANDILADAAEQCKSYIYAFKSETDKMVADIESRSKTVAELDARKLMLAAKTRMLDQTFARAVEKLAALDSKTCNKLLVGMLEAAAEDGDVITIGKRQQNCLTFNDVAEISRRKGITLTLSDSYGNFDGMILSGSGVDKNLTFEVEVALLRDEMETQIAKEIFG